MVLIPNDIGIRMRLQNEAQLLQPVAPLTEILADLPDIQPGQQFTARILEALPQGTYKALIAGKESTLSLNQGAKAGDTLELVLVDRSSRSLIAQVVVPASGEAVAEATKPYPFTNLSRAAQLIGTLLPDEGQAAAPAALNAGKPIIDGPPINTAALASALKASVKSSGLFYEAHQAQWVTGRYPLAQLLDEPQAQYSNFSKLVTHLLQSGGGGAASLSAPAAQIPPAALGNPLQGASAAIISAGEPPPLLTTTTPGNAAEEVTLTQTRTTSPEGAPREARPAGTSANEPAAREARTDAPQTPQKIPDEVRPLVQQQLEALATDRMVWHGEAWPQQMVEWEIERDAQNSSQDPNEESLWNTTLALTTPHLGHVDAKLQLSLSGIRIVIAADTTQTAVRMREALPQLKSSLEASGVPLLGFVVREPEPPAEVG